ncbi:MAG: hypothetical protein AB7P99_14045 [Vicinamibacterales bacterium]
MPTLDERVSYLEGRVEEHARQTDGIRDALISLERRVDARCNALDVRIDRLEQRLDSRCDALEVRMDRIDDKMSRQFVWLAGVQVTTLAAVLGAFAAAVSAFGP